MQNGQGTGLGLYISKGIMDTHNGHLLVKSEGEGLGCAFTVLLPAIVQSNESTSTADTRTTSAPSTVSESAKNVTPAPVDLINTTEADQIIKDDKSRIFLRNQVYSFSSNINDKISTPLMSRDTDILEISTFSISAGIDKDSEEVHSANETNYSDVIHLPSRLSSKPFNSSLFPGEHHIIIAPCVFVHISKNISIICRCSSIRGK